MAERTSAITRKIITNVIKDAPVAVEQITDGDLSLWGMNWIADSWFIEVMTDSSEADYTYMDRSADSQAGTYAMELTTDGSGDGPLVSNNLTTYGADGETLQVRLYGKTADGAGAAVVYGYYEDGTFDEYYYNFTGASEGTWTISVGGPSADQIETWSPTSSYTQHTYTQVTLPGANVDEGFFYLIPTGTSKTLLVDNVEFLVAAGNQVADGNMESWTEWADQISPLGEYDFQSGTDWGFFPDASDTESSYIQRATSTQAGTYAAKMIVGDAADLTDNDDRGLFRQEVSGTSGATATASVYTKSTNSKTGYMILLNANPGAHTEIWDFVANTWDSLSTTVTDLPGTDNALTCSGTASYVQNSESLTVPDSGDIVMVLMSDKGDGATPQTYWFDTVSLLINEADPVVLFDAENGSDGTNLDSGDYVFRYRTTDGTPATQYALAGDGSIESSFALIDHSGQPITFGTPTADGNPVTKTYFETNDALNIKTGSIAKLGSVSVDYKSVGQTTIYTVPTGYTLRGFYTEAKTTAATAPNNDSVARMGTSGGGYDDVTDVVIQPGSTVGDIERNFISSTSDIAAGGVVQVDVTTADTGTDLDATVYLYGVLTAV